MAAPGDLEAIRLGIDAYNRGDIEALIDRSCEDVEMVPMRSLMEGGEYRGHDGVRRFVGDMEEDWAQRSVEVDEIREVGEGFLVLGNFRAIGRASETEVRYPVAWHAIMRDGKLARLTAYSDQDTALAELDT